MKKSVKREVEKFINEKQSNCFTAKADEACYPFETHSCSIEEFRDKINWLYITHHKKLSEDFMREFQDKLYWPNVSFFQGFSEDFIREFKDKVDWYYISINKKLKLSLDFILEFEEKLKINYIVEKNNFSMKEYNKYKEKYKIHNRFEILDIRN